MTMEDDEEVIFEGSVLHQYLEEMDLTEGMDYPKRNKLDENKEKISPIHSESLKDFSGTSWPIPFSTFLMKLISKYQNGYVTQVVILLNSKHIMAKQDQEYLYQRSLLFWSLVENPFEFNDAAHLKFGVGVFRMILGIFFSIFFAFLCGWKWAFFTAVTVSPFAIFYFWSLWIVGRMALNLRRLREMIIGLQKVQIWARQSLRNIVDSLHLAQLEGASEEYKKLAGELEREFVGELSLLAGEAISIEGVSLTGKLALYKASIDRFHTHLSLASRELFISHDGCYRHFSNLQASAQFFSACSLIGDSIKKLQTFFEMFQHIASKSEYFFQKSSIRIKLLDSANFLNRDKGVEKSCEILYKSASKLLETVSLISKVIGENEYSIFQDDRIKKLGMIDEIVSSLGSVVSDLDLYRNSLDKTTKALPALPTEVLPKKVEVEDEVLEYEQEYIAPDEIFEGVAPSSKTEPEITAEIDYDPLMAKQNKKVLLELRPILVKRRSDFEKRAIGGMEESCQQIPTCHQETSNETFSDVNLRPVNPVVSDNKTVATPQQYSSINENGWIEAQSELNIELSLAKQAALLSSNFNTLNSVETFGDTKDE